MGREAEIGNYKIPQVRYIPHMKLPFQKRPADNGQEGDTGEQRPKGAPLAAPRGGAATLSATMRDLLVITYAVPADTVRPHIPEKLPLDMLPDPEGERLAFVQTLCAYHESARWSPLPEHVGSSYHQVSHRVLTRREGKRGAFVFRTYVSTSEAHGTQRSAARDADYGRFSVYIDGDPARGTYKSYSIRAVGDLGKTAVEVKALAETPEAPPAPFGKFEEMIAFLTDRSENYFRASAPKAGIGLLPIQQGAITAVSYGEMVSAKQSIWTEMGIVSAEAQMMPLNILLAPSVPFTSYPPRYARFPK
jgi:hypothetical protein